MKICYKCQENKDLSNFYKDSFKNNGYKTICIVCSKTHYENNKEKILKRGREYYKKHSSDINERKKKYHKEKELHFKEYRKKYHLKNIEKAKLQNKKNYELNKNEILEKFNNRLKSDPFFKFIHNLKTNIRSSIYSHGYSKKSRTYKILGIPFSEFKLYIENQFKEGMSWENHGKWHLDHKIPISWAKTEEEALMLCHYKNFQPLWAEENLIKGNKYSS